MHTHSRNNLKEFKERLFVKKPKSDDGSNDTKQDSYNVTSVLRITEKLLRAIQNGRLEMLTFDVVLFQDNARPHAGACTRALLENFNGKLSDHPPYSRDLAPSDYHLS
jgi:hypothetical protein